jgi:predicted ABC-type ATPase
MFILAGPNGAGKSTLYDTVIKDNVKAPFFNADLIQKEELKDQSMNGAYEAAKIAEERRQASLTNKKSFVTESTFSHPSKLQLIDEAKEAGFRVVLYHVNVRSPNLSVARVAERVKEGGHNVPEEKIRARYERNQSLIKQAATKSDRAFIYDNSVLNKPPTLAMSMKNGVVDRLAESVPAWARELYKDQLKPFSQTRQNEAAASFKDVKDIARKVGGENANVNIPNKKKQQYYEGKIVGESSLHILQKSDKKNQYTPHFKSNLDKISKVGDNALIDYQSKSKAVVTTPYEKGTNKQLDSLNDNLQSRKLDPSSINKIMTDVSTKLKTNTNEKSNKPSTPGKDNDFER